MITVLVSKRRFTYVIFKCLIKLKTIVHISQAQLLPAEHLLSVPVVRTLEQFQAGASSGADVADLVLSLELGAAGGRISAANDGRGALLCRFNDSIHHSLRPFCEILKLEHTRRSAVKIQWTLGIEIKP